MPELPEVETIRLTLLSSLLGRRIHRVRGLADPRYVGIQSLEDCRILALSRRGKYLIADLGDRELVIHLGMTGRLGVNLPAAVPVRHLRLSFLLDDGRVLHFCDQRRFGSLHVVPAGDYSQMPTLAQMGPEPLSPAFCRQVFRVAMARAVQVKPLLLGQRVVAGLGNIYVDEALHRARLHPECAHLLAAQADRLYDAIKEVLTEAIANRGTSFRDYVDGKGDKGGHQTALQVYGREGEPCMQCGTPIARMVIQNRGTHYCPSCQAAIRRRRKPSG